MSMGYVFIKALAAASGRKRGAGRYWERLIGVKEE